ncbi:MAG: zinc-binding dehydrogenase [Candidatus Dormiibacterota bacterium]
MRQAVLIGPARFEMQDRAIPNAGPGEVRVRVAACGTCASEMASWEDGPGERGDLLFGHEVSGTVDQVGSGVDTFRPGTPVTGLFHGGFAEYAATEASKVVALPEGLGPADVMGEPISCVVSAVSRLRIELGDVVAIVGLGYMGLLTLQLARLRGPARVIGVDPRPDARGSGLRAGADAVLAPEELDSTLLVGMRKGIVPDTGVDVAVEATGVQAGLELAGKMVREHGQLAVLGYHNHNRGRRQIDMQLWNWKALDVLNAHDRRDDYKVECLRRGVRLLAGGRIDTRWMNTHRFPLEDVGAAFQAMRDKPNGYVKGVVDLTRT